jgi:hypothetical protein
MFELPYIKQIQLVRHTINTSPTRGIKTHHITASVITPLDQTILNPQNLIAIFNLYLYHQSLLFTNWCTVELL